jgi:hypothetical protein
MIMDEGPFRASRPADRRAVVRPEPAYRQPEEPQQPKQEPPRAQAPVSRSVKSDEKSINRFKLPVGILLAALIIAIVVFSVVNGGKNGGTAIDSNKYQAVFFTNGQVYFGKLETMNADHLKLTDVYYLQTQSGEGEEANPQETSSDQSDVQLVKLGEEIHGPEDEMIISKDQVLFYENIKDDGKVGQSIASYKKSQQ